MKQHVNKVVSNCYYHLWRLFQLQSSVTQNVMLHLVTSLVLQRIDSCNHVLINLPTSMIAPLQRVHNTAVRLVLGLDHKGTHHANSEETSLAICQPPHYLQNRYTDALHTPPGLSDISLRSSTFRQHWFQQKSSSIWAATTVRTRTKLGDCTFSAVGPWVWKSSTIVPAHKFTHVHGIP